MAFVRILKRSATSILPLANKPIAPMVPRLSIVGKSTHPVNQFRAFWYRMYDDSLRKSSRSEKSLRRAVESAIEAANQQDEEEIPYKVHVWPYPKGIRLTRNFQDDTIEVESSVRNFQDDRSISLDVKIHRKSGRCCLMFECWSHGDSLKITNFEVPTEEGTHSNFKREFSTLDENMQKGLVKYLDTRGINLSMIKFIEDHWKQEESKISKLCLEKLEEFFAKE